jgi:NIMA (never in mitosis gene a)-related kinase
VKSALTKHGYQQLRKVGEGSFGAAILCQDASDKDKDSKAIVKMIDISRATRQEREDALKESRVLSQLRHPYIVRYRENFLEDGWLCIVMDYCEGGDLSDRIKRMRSQRKSFPEEQVLRWFTQAILALKYIHDMKILHRDLKSGNFFLSKSGNMKMGDFGIAKVLECTAACAQTQIGTPYYLSPEICSGRPYSWGSDIWSMGCILYEMCARRVPFDAPDLKGLIRKITQGPPPEFPNEYSSGLKNLAREMLARNPDDRPQAQDVLKRPVVQEVVRRMLDEVKGEEDEDRPAGNASEPAPAAAAGSNGRRSDRAGASSGGGQQAAGNYSRNDAVEYWSETHKEWLPATITNVDDDGRIMLNVKPNVWLGMEVQAAKVRPKEGAGASQENAGGDRPPRGSSAARPPPSGAAGRSPAVRQSSQDPGAMRRQGSRDAIAGGRQEANRYPTPGSQRPGREPSPRRDAPAAGAGSARGGTPDRRRDVPPAAGGRSGSRR